MVLPIQHPQEPKGNAIRRRYAAVIPQGQGTYTPSQAVVTHASGCYLRTLDGRRLLDMASGVLVCNLGHRHKRFEALLRRYSRGLPRNTYNLLTPILVDAAEALLRSTERAEYGRVLWAASGTEAVHKAMWTALRYQAPKRKIVATRGGFHGKKGLAADVTGETSNNPDVLWITFPRNESVTAAQIQAELDALAAEHAGNVALLITEPYLGAAGSYHPPEWYHPLLEAWCRRHGVLYILDEVQSSFGRTGAMYAFQKYSVTPDLVILGKGMGNGVPTAAVVGRSELFDVLEYGEASDTYSAHSLACAAVRATLKVFEECDIVGHVQQCAPMLRACLEELCAEFPFIKAVRGEGFVYGVEMVDKETANRAVLEAYYGTGKHGVHFLGPLAGTVLRVSPPLILNERDLAFARRVLRSAWGRMGK